MGRYLSRHPSRLLQQRHELKWSVKLIQIIHTRFLTLAHRRASIAPGGLHLNTSLSSLPVIRIKASWLLFIFPAIRIPTTPKKTSRSPGSYILRNDVLRVVFPLCAVYLSDTFERVAGSTNVQRLRWLYPDSIALRSTVYPYSN